MIVWTSLVCVLVSIVVHGVTATPLSRPCFPSRAPTWPVAGSAGRAAAAAARNRRPAAQLSIQVPRGCRPRGRPGSSPGALPRRPTAESQPSCSRALRVSISVGTRKAVSQAASAGIPGSLPSSSSSDVDRDARDRDRRPAERAGHARRRSSRPARRGCSGRARPCPRPRRASAVGDVVGVDELELDARVGQDRPEEGDLVEGAAGELELAVDRQRPDQRLDQRSAPRRRRRCRAGRRRRRSRCRRRIRRARPRAPPCGPSSRRPPIRASARPRSAAEGCPRGSRRRRPTTCRRAASRRPRPPPRRRCGCPRC